MKSGRFQIVADRFEESMERNKRLIQLIKAEAVMSGNREIGRSVNALAGRNR